MLIRFDGPGCHVINIHEKSSHCETLKSNRKKKKQIFQQYLRSKRKLQINFLSDKKFSQAQIEVASRVKGHFRSYGCMSLFGREAPTTNVYSALRTVYVFENLIG